MLTQCNFKFGSNGHVLCTKKFFITAKPEVSGAINMLFDCDGEMNCMEFLTYRNTELILSRIK